MTFDNSNDFPVGIAAPHRSVPVGSPVVAAMPGSGAPGEQRMRLLSWNGRTVRIAQQIMMARRASGGENQITGSDSLLERPTDIAEMEREAHRMSAILARHNQYTERWVGDGERLVFSAPTGNESTAAVRTPEFIQSLRGHPCPRMGHLIAALVSSHDSPSYSYVVLSHLESTLPELFANRYSLAEDSTRRRPQTAVGRASFSRLSQMSDDD